jgi:hypothetical protein
MSVFGHTKTRGPGPSGPHRFVEPDDARAGLALGALQPNLQLGPALAVTDASLREARCAMQGCGKVREDPIHDVPA